MNPGSALAPSRRLVQLLIGALLLFAASPGITGRDGSLLLAVLGAAVWAGTAVRPLGARPAAARWAEWLAGAVGGGLLVYWVVHVVWGGVLYIAAGWGVYGLVSGILLRLLARRFSLPLAAGLAWAGVETVRAWVLPPFGLGWLRLGHQAHAHLWLSGGARVFGVEGLSFVIACLGGGLAAVVLERRARAATLAGALAPLLVTALAALAVPAPRTVDGPRVLLIQPGFSQKRKQFDDPRKNFEDSRQLTLASLQELRTRGEPEPDLVSWGESMLYVPLFDAAVEEAVRAGLQAPPWRTPLDPVFLARAREAEDRWVRGEILGLGASPGSEGVLAPGTSFCAGADVFVVEGDEIRRQVALVAYDSAGRRSEVAPKRRLVPLGETMFGFERFGWVRAIAERAAGYIPDLLAGERTRILELPTRDGRRFLFSGTICFDNAFPEVYVDALRSGSPAFHLVASNEAWYRESCEMDQMVAFSRLIAISTARSIVRATNSGVSLVIGPDGHEVGRIEVGGKDRSVRAAAAWTVPVPAPGQAERTPLVRLFGFWRPFWVAVLGWAALVSWRARNRAMRSG